MTKAAILGLVGLLALAARADTQTCGTANYDPAHYVCHDNNFLCPIIAGEGLSYCSGACYSTYMYTCTNNALAQLPPLADGSAFTLAAANPTNTIVDGLAINACGLQWNVGGSTCSYCPEIAGVACPAGNTTVLKYNNGGTGLSTIVPGGQQLYIRTAGTVGYTQAHSASMPSGAVLPNFAAYGNGGGLVNLASNYGWAACPPTAAGGGGGADAAYTLVALTAENNAQYSYCIPINLKIIPVASDTVGAWQYV